MRAVHAAFTKEEVGAALRAHDQVKAGALRRSSAGFLNRYFDFPEGGSAGALRKRLFFGIMVMTATCAASQDHLDMSGSVPAAPGTALSGAGGGDV